MHAADCVASHAPPPPRRCRGNRRYGTTGRMLTRPQNVNAPAGRRPPLILQISRRPWHTVSLNHRDRTSMCRLRPGPRGPGCRAADPYSHVQHPTDIQHGGGEAERLGGTWVRE